MKKVVSTVLTAVLLCAVFFTGCNSEQKAAENQSAFDTYQAAIKKHDELKSLSLKVSSKTDSSDDEQDNESVSTSLVAKPEGEFSRRLTTTKSKGPSGEMETIEYFDGEFYFNNYDGTKWEKVIPIKDKIAATEISARSLYGDFTIEHVDKSSMVTENGVTKITMSLKFESTDTWKGSVELEAVINADGYLQKTHTVSKQEFTDEDENGKKSVEKVQVDVTCEVSDWNGDVKVEQPASLDKESFASDASESSNASK